MSALATSLPLAQRRKSDDLLRAIALTSVFGDRTVLEGVDLAIRRGEIFVVMGPSGCGKTTLLRHMCGLLPPTLGAVTVDGKDVYGSSSEVVESLRRRTGLSFQGGALLGSLSVLENVALPLRENTDLPERVIRSTARMKLEMVGLLHAADLLPSSLSGGMKKRAAIARAIALDPELVFFDEPSAGLDPITAAEVDNSICKLNQVFGITMVVVTHDLSSAYEIADRIVVLLDGRVAALGERDEVWHSQNPRIRDFIDRRLSETSSRGAGVAGMMEI
ncbi:MAG: ATP-binding cassette domain-containing protein [Planctomycetota bacterium]